MEQLFIICVDDQKEVLNALERDLAVFDQKFTIEVCDSAAEALELMEEIDGKGDFTAVVISDQVMPGMNGVEFLSTINNDNRFHDIQKMLLTGQATHQDTIQAINLGGIGQYVEKPWKKDQIVAQIKSLLTRFILSKGLDHHHYLPLLDQEILFSELRKMT